MEVEGCDQIEGVTLHSLSLRILMRNDVLEATGRTPRPLNDFEIKALEADLSDAHGGKREIRKKIKAFEAAWARLQHEEPGYVRTPEDASFQADLISWLVFHEAMLIGEVIPQLYNYLSSNPAAGERREFAHILVDEYQDLNRAEQGVITLLSDDAHVCVVGDDDQSIYSFKHAHPDGIRDWLADKPGAYDVGLDECRRCPTRAVAMANALIAHNVNRSGQRALTPLAANGEGLVRVLQFSSLNAEITGIVNVVRDMVDNHNIPPGDILILAQRGVIGTPIYDGLSALHVPVRSYYAEAELDADDARRRFALLKLFVDRQDRVALRWLLGLGSGSWLSGNYRRLREHCEATGNSPWDALESLEAGILRIPHTGALVSRLTLLKGEIEALEQLGQTTGLQGVIDSLFPESDLGVRDLRELALKTLETFGAEDRNLFLGELTSAIAKPEIPSEVYDVRIMSLHKSKGLSAPVTIIAGCVNGLLPKQPDRTLPQAERIADLEEQRRLFFVGISRVKATPTQGKPGTLLLTYSLRMPLADAMKAGITPAQMVYGDAILHASPFIGEMRPAVPDAIAMQ